MSKEAEEIIQDEVIDVLALQKSYETAERELMKDERFRSFLQLQKQVNAQVAEMWLMVERHMIEHGIKSVKGEYGSLTIAERHTWETTEALPAKYYKKVVDTGKLTKTYQLEGKEPKGSKLTYKYNLVKRLK